MELFVRPKGEIECLYSDELELSAIGKLTIRRANHVEPDEQGLWHADLSPVNGPTLGPFSKRSEALAAEEAWLRANRLSH